MEPNNENNLTNPIQSELEETRNFKYKPLSMSLEMREVAELTATKGMTDQRVSEITGVPITAIKRWKKHPDFAKYQQDFVLELAKTMRAEHLMMCYKTLDARKEKIEEIGDWSLFSSKDSLEIMDSMRKIQEKDEEKEQSHYMKTIEALIAKTNQITFKQGGES